MHTFFQAPFHLVYTSTERPLPEIWIGVKHGSWSDFSPLCLELSHSEATLCLNRHKWVKTPKSWSRTFTSGFNTHVQTCMQHHYCSSLSTFSPSLSPPRLHSTTLTHFPMASSHSTLISLPPLSHLFFKDFVLLIAFLYPARPSPLPPLCLLLFIHVKQHMNKACHYCSGSLSSYLCVSVCVFVLGLMHVVKCGQVHRLILIKWDKS